MSIASFTAASLEQAASERYDVALALACLAIDGTTAKTPSLQKLANNKRNKQFLDQNMATIIDYGFPGITASSIRIKCLNIDDLKTDRKSVV